MKISLTPMALAPYRTKPTELTYKNDIHTMMYRVKQIGYDGIEGGTPEGYTHQEYKERMDEIGLQVVTAGRLDYFKVQNENFDNIIEECHTLGAKNTMIGSMNSMMLGNPYELKKFIKGLDNAGRILKDAGIHLSYHNHAVDFSKINGKRIIDAIIEGTDPEYVYFEPDTHWIQAGGAHVITWLKKLRRLKKEPYLNVEWMNPETGVLSSGIMYMDDFKVSLKHDTSAGGLWMVSFSLEDLNDV